MAARMLFRDEASLRPKAWARPFGRCGIRRKGWELCGLRRQSGPCWSC